MEHVYLLATRDNRLKYHDFIKQLAHDYVIEPCEGFGQKGIHLVIGGDECLQDLKNMGTPDPNEDKRDIIYFPCGENIDFARSLGLETAEPTVEDFNHMRRGRHFVDVPIMQCNGRRFINMAQVGSLAQWDQSFKVKGTIRTTQQSYRISFGMGGSTGVRSFETLGFIVAQGLYGLGGLRCCTAMSPLWDDVFEFLTVRGNERSHAIRSFLQLQHDECDLPLDIISIKTQCLSIVSNSPMPVNLDGEYFNDYSFHFARDGGKLRFLLN